MLFVPWLRTHSNPSIGMDYQNTRGFLLTGILEWKDDFFDSTCCPKGGQILKILTVIIYCWRASQYMRECMVNRSHKSDLKLHLLWAHLQLSGKH